MRSAFAGSAASGSPGAASSGVGRASAEHDEADHASRAERGSLDGKRERLRSRQPRAGASTAASDLADRDRVHDAVVDARSAGGGTARRAGVRRTTTSAGAKGPLRAGSVGPKSADHRRPDGAGQVQRAPCRRPPRAARAARARRSRGAWWESSARAAPVGGRHHAIGERLLARAPGDERRAGRGRAGRARAAPKRSAGQSLLAQPPPGLRTTKLARDRCAGEPRARPRDRLARRRRQRELAQAHGVDAERHAAARGSCR